MKQKRLFLFILSAIFLTVLFALVYITFMIKEVKITYACAECEYDTAFIEKKLQKYNGKSLLFFITNNLKNDLSDFSYFEIEKIEKKFPSSLNVKLKERHQAYYVETDSDNIILSDEGYVLSKNSSNEIQGGLIKLNIDNETTEYFPDKIKIITANVGEKIHTNFDYLLFQTFAYTKNIDSTDRFSSIDIFINKKLNEYDIYYTTFSKTQIHITEANKKGKEKVEKAISYYDETDDYIKSSEKHVIYVVETGGNIIVQSMRKD